MNLIEEAKALGFSDAAVISTDQLVFVPEYRVFCEDNLCGNYDKNPACPPQSGTVEEMKEHALKYEKNADTPDNAGWPYGLTKRQNLLITN